MSRAALQVLRGGLSGTPKRWCARHACDLSAGRLPKRAAAPVSWNNLA